MDPKEVESTAENAKLPNKINPLIRSMIVSDFLILSAFGIYGPIFAIFITNQIQGGTAMTVGLATASYWVVRSVFQIPISKLLDAQSGEKYNFLALITGSLIFSTVPFLFIFASLPWHIFVLQGFYGLGDSLAAPTYLSIFSAHLDRKKENVEWGTRSVLIGIGTSVTAIMGGYFADHFGFKIIFFITGVIALFGTSLLIFAKGKHIKLGMHGKQ